MVGIPTIRESPLYGATKLGLTWVKKFAPAPKDRVEGADQFRLRRMLSLLENRFDARAHVVDAGAYRFDQKLSIVLAEGEPLIY